LIETETSKFRFSTMVFRAMKPELMETLFTGMTHGKLARDQAH
jgi:hypothetical protein